MVIQEFKDLEVRKDIYLLLLEERLSKLSKRPSINSFRCARLVGGSKCPISMTEEAMVETSSASL